MTKKYSLEILAAILAFCSMCYEITIARFLSEITDNVILSQSLTIGTYLLSMGLGAHLYETRFAKRVRLSIVEVLLSVVGGLSVFFLMALLIFLMSFGFSQISVNDQIFLYLLVSQILVFAIGLLSGFELPFLLQRTQSPSWILSWNYLGAVLCAFVLPVFFVPHFSAAKLALFTSLVNLGAILVWRGFDEGRLLRNGTLVLVSASLVAFLLLQEEAIEKNFLKARYLRLKVPSVSITDLKNASRVMDRRGDIVRYRSVYQKIDIVPEKVYQPEGSDLHYELYLNYNPQFFTRNEALYHEIMAHVAPQLYGATPKKALVLGGGDGFLIEELLKRESLEKVDLIELDPKMIELGKSNYRFLQYNRSKLHDPRVHIQVADAFSFLRETKQKYDAIFIDFPYPTNYELSKLYSVEFYKFVLARLDDAGFVVLDFPITTEKELEEIQNQDRNNIIFSTLEAAGVKDMVNFAVSDPFIAFRKKGEVGLYSKSVSDLGKIPGLGERSQENLKDLNQIYRDAVLGDNYVNSVFRPRVAVWRTVF